MLLAFFDESGKTGKQYFRNSQWSFNAQPYFGLGTIVISADNYNSIIKDISQRLKTEKYQGEFKWTNKSARKVAPQVIPDLYEIIKEHNGEILIEIEDKLFSFAKIITEYCVFPYYETFIIDDREFACRQVANYLYEFLPSQVTSDICEFFDQNTKNTVALKKHIKSICDNISNDFIVSNCEETIDTIERVEKEDEPLNVENLFPIPNFNTSGLSQTCITPHIDCYNNILNRIKDKFSKVYFCQCIHDKISDLRLALKNETSHYSELTNSHMDFKVDFVDSKKEILIDTIDYILGAVLQSASSLVEKTETYNSINECYKELICNCVNFISTFEKQLLLFPNQPMVLQGLESYSEFKKM